MIKYLIENYLIIFSLLISVAAIIFTVRNYKFNSYTQKGNYDVFFSKKRIFNKIINDYDFTVRVYESSKKYIPLEYRLHVVANIGGIYRGQIFSILNDTSTIGIIKSLPIIIESREKGISFKKYAHKKSIFFSSNPFSPYFTASGKFNMEKRCFEETYYRYHFYLEIVDYANNVEIWFISFSLSVCALSSERKGWKNLDETLSYKFDDFTIVSPFDIPQNYYFASNFDKTLEDIKDRRNDSFESESLISKGKAYLNHELQLYEMKEYINYVNILKRENII